MDLKFPYLGRSRFLCYKQREPGHLGSMPQENTQHNQSILPLILPNGRWLGRYQSRRYDAAKSRNRRTEGLAGVVEFHFRTRCRDEGSLYNSFAYAKRSRVSASWLSRNEVTVINLPSLYMVHRIKIYTKFTADDTRNNWTSRDNLCRVWS